MKHAVGAFVAVVAATIASTRTDQVWVIALAGLGAWTIAWWFTTRDSRRRRAFATQQFPEPWEKILTEEVAFYRLLNESERERFRYSVSVFLAEQRISGVRGAPISESTRLLIAAAAVTLIFGHPTYHYDALRDILVYPDAFDDEYNVERGGHILGQVGTQTSIILSERALRDGFKKRDGHNVAMHEFAHVLDFDDGSPDGVPSLAPWNAVNPWVEMVHKEKRLVNKHRSVLRKYAATNEAEFFAVATEMFFERPLRMREKHPALYAALAEIYAFDPAKKTDAP